MPRVLAAHLADAARTLAGTLVQAVPRTALAEPGVLCVSGGAAPGAVLLLTTVWSAGSWGVTGAPLAGAAGAAVSSVIVFGLAARGRFPAQPPRPGWIGVATGTTAVVTLLIVLTARSTRRRPSPGGLAQPFGRPLPDTAPLAAALAVGATVAALRCPEPDLVSLDEDRGHPRLLGLGPVRSRFGFLLLSVLLSATAVAAAGAVGFVGLIAPHAARALVGRRYAACSRSPYCSPPVDVVRGARGGWRVGGGGARS